MFLISFSTLIFECFSFQSLKVLKNPEFMPYIIFIAAPSAEALMVMYEDGRRKGVGRGVRIVIFSIFSIF